MSNGRVYDPIHDVFQVQKNSEVGPPILVPNSSVASVGGQRDGPDSAGGSMGRDTIETGQFDQDDESTQSDELRPPVDYSASSTRATQHTPTKKKGKEPSRYTRHLKKQDGEQFTRKDIQFAFLFELLSDKRQIFENVFENAFSITPQQPEKGDELSEEECGTLNVTDVEYNARFFIGNEKLTFSQLYVLTVASSKKCSKILRDKLLFDHQVAFSTCVLSLLVNFGRLNTTVNFFPEMTSQLRTFHSIPCLQHQTRDPKSLQDTPRIKSILKTIPVGQEPPKLSAWYASPENHFRVNPVNLLFTLCENPQLVNVQFVFPYVDNETTLFEIFDSSKFHPRDRADFFLWLTYIHLETKLSPQEIQESLHLFDVEERFPMNIAMEEYDIDTESELIFGDHQNQRRLRFLRKHPRKAVADQQALEQQGQQESQPQPALQQQPQVQQQSQPYQASGGIPKSEPISDSILDGTSKNDESQAAHDPTSKSSALRQANKHSKTRPRTRVKVVHQEAPQTSSLGTVTSEAVQPEPQQQEEDFGAWAQEVDDMIEADSNFHVAPNLAHSVAQELLVKAHNIARKKRQELGLIKAFDEYEDVTLATVIGVRGKKRKKFNDGVLGYETDYMNYMHAAKLKFLKTLDKPLPHEHFCL